MEFLEEVAALPVIVGGSRGPVLFDSECVRCNLQIILKEFNNPLAGGEYISRHTSEAIQGICGSGTCERDITIPRITGLAVAGCHECPVGSV